MPVVVGDAGRARAGGGSAVGGATCAAGIDYAATSGTLTFPAASAAPQQVAVTV